MTLQKESELQSTRGDLEEARQRAEVAEATLESERTAFQEGKYLWITWSRQDFQESGEARVQTTTEQCQREMKVSKLKKYKNGYEDGK